MNTTHIHLVKAVLTGLIYMACTSLFGVTAVSNAFLGPTASPVVQNYCVYGQTAHVTIEATVPPSQRVNCTWQLIIQYLNGRGVEKSARIMRVPTILKQVPVHTNLIFTQDISAKLNKKLAKRTIQAKFQNGILRASLAVSLKAKPLIGKIEESTMIRAVTIYLVNPALYTISGQVSGDTQQGVTIMLYGTGSDSTITDGGGNYSFTGLINGDYSITPSKNGYMFVPTSLDVTINGANQPGKNFVATQIPNTYSISGQVSGDTQSGVTINLTGAASSSTSTDGSGNYSFSALAKGGYTVTPSKSGYTFAPLNTNITLNGANVGNANFIAKQSGGAETNNMVLIPAGSFTMGNCMNPGEGFSNELPVHTVSVSAVYMDAYEVTYALWTSVYQWAVANGYSFDHAGSGKAANHPVHTVNWYDCVKWCNARSEKEGLTLCYYTSSVFVAVNMYKTGQRDLSNSWVNWTANGYRLPTEAEWEKAARGGTSGHRFPWIDADTIQHARANYNSSSSYAYDTSPTRGYHPAFINGPMPYTSPVGYFAPNGYGLYDMAGNVWDWCWDWYDGSWYSNGSATQNDTSGPSSISGESSRVVRGGTWAYDHCRVAFRGGIAPWDAVSYSFGFRCVRR